MNFLSNLTSIGKKRAKRVGRGYGSGKGRTSKRGTTRHQKARRNIPLWFEGGQARQVKKYPLLRGKGKNKTVKRATFAVAVAKLEKLSNNDKVTTARLVEAGIIKSKDARIEVKIVGGGKLTKKLTVNLPVTQSAREAIEKAGGTVHTHAFNNR